RRGGLLRRLRDGAASRGRQSATMVGAGPLHQTLNRPARRREFEPGRPREPCNPTVTVLAMQTRVQEAVQVLHHQIVQDNDADGSLPDEGADWVGVPLAALSGTRVEYTISVSIDEPEMAESEGAQRELGRVRHQAGQGRCASRCLTVAIK